MAQSPGRFMVVPFSNGLWKILDFKVGRYTRSYYTEREANRYASRKNSEHRRAAAPRCVLARDSDGDWSWTPAETVEVK